MAAITSVLVEIAPAMRRVARVHGREGARVSVQILTLACQLQLALSSQPDLGFADLAGSACS